ncbi:unnamed protein product [Citrullus colocynthis]|uniref:Uncharacterized protein n=1 Tax=Citrullus colocynthis TaxID=252529 RepID=A0ABP0XZA3_9ROSI
MRQKQNLALAAYLFFAILVASFSPSSPSKVAAAATSYGISYLPPLPRSLLFRHDSSYLPSLPAAKEYLAKPLRRVNGERKNKCTKAHRNGDKVTKPTKDPWPKCSVRKSPLPPF